MYKFMYNVKFIFIYNKIFLSSLGVLCWNHLIHRSMNKATEFHWPHFFTGQRG